MSRCSASAEQCAYDADSVERYCSGVVCKTSVTASQLTCNDGLTCDAKNRGDFTTECPPGVTETTAACGAATCAAGEYCMLTYDPAAGTWEPGACVAKPQACESAGLSTVCECMKAKACAPGEGVRIQCKPGTAALAFGCRKL